ncbi:MAG: hypothetical protein Q8M76_01295 [Spirochaetaceae bacterium]|nr:hypothetical protein [Spirochaetaceae bacterium]
MRSTDLILEGIEGMVEATAGGCAERGWAEKTGGSANFTAALPRTSKPRGGSVKGGTRRS